MPRRWFWLLLPLLTAFPMCPHPVPGGIVSPYDFSLASDMAWSLVVMNDHVQFLPVNGNRAPAFTVPWDYTWDCGLGSVGDPQVALDPVDGRWWVAETVGGPVGVGELFECLSVSATTDPTGVYTSVVLPNVADGQKLVVTADKATLTGLYTDGQYHTTAVSKDLAEEQIVSYPPGVWQMPAMNVANVSDPTERAFFGLTDPGALVVFGPSPLQANAAELVLLTGVPPTLQEQVADVPLGVSLATPPSAVLHGIEPNGTAVIFPGGDAAGVVTLTSLWFTHIDGHDTLNVFQVSGLNPLNPYLAQHMKIAPPAGLGGALGCQSIGVLPDDQRPPDNSVVVGYAVVSPSAWLSAMTQQRHRGDPWNTLRPPVMRGQGYQGAWPDPPTGQRLDYCSAAMAPDGTVLTVQPYHTGSADGVQVMVSGVTP